MIKPHEYIETLIDSCDEVISSHDLKRISKEIHSRGLKDALVEVHGENMIYGSEYRAYVTELLINLVTEIENT